MPTQVVKFLPLSAVIFLGGSAEATHAATLGPANPGVTISVRANPEFCVQRPARGSLLVVDDCSAAAGFSTDWIYEQRTGRIRSRATRQLCWGVLPRDWGRGTPVAVTSCGDSNAFGWTFNATTGHIHARPRANLCVRRQRSRWKRGRLVLGECSVGDAVLKSFNVGASTGNDILKRRLQIREQTRLCPNHVYGDRDFRGHGPSVSARARLVRSPDRRKVVLETSFTAAEPQPDFTNARGSWTKTVFRAPVGMRIAPLPDAFDSKASYVDTDHDLDFPSPDGTLVDDFRIKGDTSGNDVGRCTSDDTYMTVVFNPVTLQLEPEEPLEAMWVPRRVFSKLCPARRGTGDKDFKGHGPKVRAWGRLHWGDGTLTAKLFLNLRETKSDWTEAEQTWTRTLAHLPTGYKVKEVLVPTLSRVQPYVSSGHSARRFSTPGPVGIFEIRGDSPGGDVGNCGNVSRDSYMSVETRRFKVIYEYE